MRENIGMTKRNNFTRRQFLAVSGAAAGAMAFSARSYARILGANDRLRIGMIGCGGMAGNHLEALIKMKEEDNIEIVSVCDVYGKRAKSFQAKIQQAGGSASMTQEYRDVLDRSDIDKLVIATPEHSHAHITLDALDAGKHIYVEKPMTHTIRESQDVVKKVGQTGLKVQVGVQGMADDSYSSAHTAIKGGALGMVVEAQIDYVRSYSEGLGPWRREDVHNDTPLPGDLDWRTWLRPVRNRPWDPHHYYEWRCYKLYSGGIATDLFIHRLTRILKACGLAMPSSVTGMGGIYTWDDGRDLPDSFEMLAEYPAIQGITNGMTVHVLGTMANGRGNDHMIRGNQATLTFTKTGWQIRDNSGNVVQTHEKTGGEDVTPHHMNHNAAIREGAELYCPVELGLHGLAAVRMANLSLERRKVMVWNSRRNRAVAG